MLQQEHSQSCYFFSIQKKVFIQFIIIIAIIVTEELSISLFTVEHIISLLEVKAYIIARLRSVPTFLQTGYLWF